MHILKGEHAFDACSPFAVSAFQRPASSDWAEPASNFFRNINTEFTNMQFDLDRSIEVLKATPATLHSLLGGLSTEWTRSSNDPESWQPFDVLGHLIHADMTDWIPRARIILAQGEDSTFEPFDRVAQFEAAKSKTMANLLDQFAGLRTENLEILGSWELVEDELGLEGNHPELGRVTLRQLLATWVVHDLTHIQQIVTVMALNYDDQVGPWREYLSILK